MCQLKDADWVKQPLNGLIGGFYGIIISTLPQGQKEKDKKKK